MGIKLDPCMTALLPRSTVVDTVRSDPPKQQATKRGPATTGEMPAPGLHHKVPVPPSSRPAPNPKVRAQAPLHKETTALLLALNKGGTKVSMASKVAGELLALCTAYPLRRSRGGRKRGLDLCDEVMTSGDTDEETQLNAAMLRDVLLAEGAIHQCAGDPTLRACMALIAMLDENS